MISQYYVPDSGAILIVCDEQVRINGLNFNVKHRFLNTLSGYALSLDLCAINHLVQCLTNFSILLLYYIQI